MGRPLIPGLAEELVAAAARRQRRRRRHLRLVSSGAAALLLVVGVTVVTAIDAPPAEAGVDITVRDGRIFVRLTDTETRPGVVEEVLREAGIDAEVTGEPVGPSNVGRFVGLRSEDGPAVELIDADAYSSAGFSVDEDYEGALDVGVGRPAQPGEPYRVASYAFQPGEPLACRDLVGQPASTLPALVASEPDLDIDVIVFDDAGAPARLPAADVLASPVAGWVIADAWAASPSEVMLVLTVDGAPAFTSPPPAMSSDCD